MGTFDRLVLSYDGEFKHHLNFHFDQTQIQNAKLVKSVLIVTCGNSYDLYLKPNLNDS